MIRLVIPRRGGVLKRLIKISGIEKWCQTNLLDHEWDLLDVDGKSIKNSRASLSRIEYFCFSNDEVATIVELKFGI